jgi:hypothetical protein
MKVKGYISRLDINHDTPEAQSFGLSPTLSTGSTEQIFISGRIEAKAEIIFTEGDFQSLFRGFQLGELVEIDFDIEGEKVVRGPSQLYARMSERKGEKVLYARMPGKKKDPFPRKKWRMIRLK